MNLCAIIRAKTSFPAKCKHGFHGDEIPRRERYAILLARAIFILFAIIPRTFHSNFLSAILIVFIDHTCSVKLFFENISHFATLLNFYHSTSAINSYVYELAGELIIIAYPRLVDFNKFRSPAEIEAVIISPSLTFNVANGKKKILRQLEREH